MVKRNLFAVVLLFSLLVGNVGAAPPPPVELPKALEPDIVLDVPCPYPDPYETMGGGERDDSFTTASPLTTAGQPGHTFDRWKDKDWAEFVADAGTIYIIATANLTPTLPTRYADTVLELYDSDGVTLLVRSDDVDGTYASRVVWQATEAITYYVKVYNFVSGFFGCDVGYDLIMSEQKPLSVVKSAEDLNGAPLLVGDIIRYTIVVTNPSPAPQTNVVITDPIPSGVTLVADSVSVSPSAGWDIVSQTPMLEVNGASIAAGGAVVVTFDVQVNAGQTGQTIENRAFVQSDQMPSALGTPPVTPPGGGTVAAGLDVVKQALDLNGSPLLPGDLISYTIIVTNNSSFVHTNVVITDIIPAGTTYVNGSAGVTPPGTVIVTPILRAGVPQLAPGGVVRVWFTVSVNEGVNQIGGNTVYVSSDQQNTQTYGPVYPPPGNGLVSALGILKVAEDVNGGPLYPGDEILYSIAVENLLTQTQTSVVITDYIPNYTTYVPGSGAVTVGALSGPDPLVAQVGSLAPGQQAVLRFRVTVDDDAAGQVITNTAHTRSQQQPLPVSFGPVEPEPGGGMVNAGAQALSIRKTAQDVNGGPLYEGDEILYTVVVVNLEDEPQSGVVITDEIPAHTAYVDGSANVTPGVILHNDPIVADVGTLPAGGTATLVFRVTVSAGATGQTVANIAEASSPHQQPPVFTPPVQPYPDPIQDFPQSGGGVVIPGSQQIGITKSAVDVDGAPLQAYDLIEYTIVAWNLVSVPQTNVVIADYIPDFTTYVPGSLTATMGTLSGPDPLNVSIAALGVGESVTVTFRVMVDAGVAGQRVANEASATSDQQVPPAYTGPAEPQPGGGIIQPGSSALDVTKMAEDVNGGVLYPHDVILYTIIVANPLHIPQTSVVIEDDIPAYTTYVDGSASVTLGSITSEDPIIATVGTLPPYQAVTLTFQVTVDSNAVGHVITNTAQASSAQQVPPAVVGPIEPQPGGGMVHQPYIYLPLLFRNG